MEIARWVKRRSRDIIYNRIKKVLDALTLIIERVDGPTVLRCSVYHRVLELIIVSLKVAKQVKDLVFDLWHTACRPVDFVDDHDRFQTAL